MIEVSYTELEGFMSIPIPVIELNDWAVKFYIPIQLAEAVAHEILREVAENARPE